MKSTFFVPGWTAERWPDVVAEIHRRGHEIGHHGYLHEALEGKSREEEEAILTGSSTILANITGSRPVGYRAPLYEITYATTGLLARHGFLYASNLQDSLWPYRHADAPSLVELPASWILDDGPFFAFGLRPNLYRQIFPPSAVLSVWRGPVLGQSAPRGRRRRPYRTQDTRPLPRDHHPAPRRVAVKRAPGRFVPGGMAA